MSIQKDSGAVFRLLVVGLGILCIAQLATNSAAADGPVAPPKIEDFEGVDHMLTREKATEYLKQYFASLHQTNIDQMVGDVLATYDRRDGKSHNKKFPYPKVASLDPKLLQDILAVPKPVEEAQPRWVTNVLNHLLVRATYQDIRSIQDPRDREESGAPKQAQSSPQPSPGNAAEANPGTISFFRNNTTGSNEWYIKATVAVLGNVITNAPFGGRDQWLPSVSLDKEFNNLKPTNSVDSLIFRVANIYENIGDSDVLDFGTLRLAGDYGTDTGFKSLVAGAELDWTPNLAFFNNRTLFGDWRPSQGYGQYSTLFDLNALGNWVPQIRWDAGLHTEYGYTVKAGHKPQLAGDHNSVRIGPVFNVSLQPFPYTLLNLNQFIINLSYEYLSGPVGKPTSSHDFKVTASYPLLSRGSQSLSLTATYEDGLAPIVKDKVDSFNVGLGVKF